MKTKIALILLPLTIALYITLRIDTIKQIDNYSDSFFATFSKADQPHIQKYLNINLKSEKILPVIKKHYDAIANFDYKSTKPTVNYLLNRASLDVSWHLTIVFEKQGNSWNISEFRDYGND